MSRLCALCRERPVRRDFGRSRYCAECYDRFVASDGKLDLPAGHPFTKERRRRVERMRKRAAAGKPIFEQVEPDLS